MALALVLDPDREDALGTLWRVEVGGGPPPADGAASAAPKLEDGGAAFAWRSPNDDVLAALRALAAASKLPRRVPPALEEFLEWHGDELLEHAGLEDEEALEDHHRVAFLRSCADDPELASGLEGGEEPWAVADGESCLSAMAERMPLPDWADWESYDDGGAGAGFDNVGLLLEPGRTLEEWVAWYAKAPAPHAPPTAAPDVAKLEQLPALLLEAEELSESDRAGGKARRVVVIELLRRSAAPSARFEAVFRAKRPNVAALRVLRLGEGSREEARLQALWARRAALTACLPFHGLGEAGREGLLSRGLAGGARVLAADARASLAAHREATERAIAALDRLIVACWCDRYYLPEELVARRGGGDGEA